MTTNLDGIVCRISHKAFVKTAFLTLQQIGMLTKLYTMNIFKQSTELRSLEELIKTKCCVARHIHLNDFLKQKCYTL